MVGKKLCKIALSELPLMSTFTSLNCVNASLSAAVPETIQKLNDDKITRRQNGRLHTCRYYRGAGCPCLCYRPVGVPSKCHPALLPRTTPPAYMYQRLWRSLQWPVAGRMYVVKSGPMFPTGGKH